MKDSQKDKNKRDRETLVLNDREMQTYIGSEVQINIETDRQKDRIYRTDC